MLKPLPVSCDGAYGDGKFTKSHGTSDLYRRQKENPFLTRIIEGPHVVLAGTLDGK